MAPFLESVRILLPVVVLLGAGALLGSGRFTGGRTPDLRRVSWISLYFLAPCLVFSGLFRGPAHVGPILTLFLTIVLFLSALGALAIGVSAKLGQAPAGRAGYLLAVLFGNSGYYGMPVCYLAFGEAGLAHAAMYMVCTSILSNTVGIFLAARGKLHWSRALSETLRSPMFWTLIVTLGIRFTGFDCPPLLLEAVDLVAKITVPVILLLLGAQLSQLDGASNRRLVASASVLRLVAAPVLAVLVTQLVGLEGLLRQVVIVEAGMPTAILAGLFAVHFDNEAQLVSGTILLSTLLSPLSLGLLLVLVR